MKKKVLSLALALVMALSLAAPAFADELPKGWIPADGARPAGDMIKPIEGENSTAIPTAAEAEAFVNAKGWMTGTDKGFAPDQKVNRATVYEMFWKMEGKKVVNYLLTYTDMPKDVWYTESARWATSEGLTNGTGNNRYDGERNMTKAEVLTVLYRYMKDYKKLDVSVEQGWSLDVFEDADKIQPWGKDALLWAWLSGVACQDDSDPTLKPGQEITRIQLAQMLTVMGGLMDKPAADAVTGKGVSASKYGNVVTDIDMTPYTVGDILKVTITGQEPLMIPYGTGYSNVDQGSPIITAVEGGVMQLAINRGDFATTYGLGTKNENGTSYTMDATKTITVSMGKKGGYLQEMELRAIDDKRTNERKDYASDEVFANFRAVTVGDIAKGKLYRGSSPVNPEIGRNTYADELLKKNGVKTVLNLADSEETMKGYKDYGKTYYSTLAIKALNLGVDTAAADFNAGLKEGLVWMSKQEAPYYIHCTEGKDRAGFVAALLELVCGATLQDVVADYMLSFQNYYFVKADSEQWSYIAASNIEKSVLDISGAKDILDAGKIDLQAAAENYLIKTVGMTADEVAALKTALTGKAAEPAKPAESAKPAEAEKPAEPAKPAESAKPAGAAVSAGTYTFKPTDVDLGANAKTDKAVIPVGTTFANGALTVVANDEKGKVVQRWQESKGGVYAVEVDKDQGSALEFTVSGNAEVTLQAASTGGTNVSMVGIVNMADGSLVKSADGKDTVMGTAATPFKYSVGAGTYQIVSPVTEDENMNRGFRVMGVEIVVK